MPRSDLLLLNYDLLDSKTESYFDALKGSPERFGRFMADPAGELTAALFEGKAKVPPQEIDRANRIVFALLSNPRFIAWARDYQRSLIAEVGRQALAAPTRRDAKRTLFQALGKRRIFLDFARGLKDFGDEQLFYAMGLKTPGAAPSLIFDPEGQEQDTTFVLVQSLIVFVQSSIVVDQNFAVHQDTVTENQADAHGVSHVDVFFVNDHVLFTTHDFFVDNSAQADVRVNAATQADANSSVDVATEIGASTDVHANAGSDVTLAAASAAEAQAEAGSAAHAATDASAEGPGLDARAEARFDVGMHLASDADASALTRLFGMSRWELQQFAAVVAQAASLHADRLRAAGALTDPAPLQRAEG